MEVRSTLYTYTASIHDGEAPMCRLGDAHLIVQGCEGTQAQATSQDDSPDYSRTKVLSSGVLLCFCHVWMSKMSHAVVMVNGDTDMYSAFRAS